MIIYIAGSGAMGCRFGYQLKKAGEDVALLDMWEDHIKAIKENGLKIIGDKEDCIQIPICKPNEATEIADLIIVFTKAMQFPTMLENIEGVIGENTKVLCLLNGLGHKDVLQKYVKHANILMGVTVWSAGLAGPGVAKLTNSGSINLQCLSAEGKDDAAPIVNVLNNAGLNAIYDEDVLPNIWRKACMNATVNSTCALLDCTIGQFVLYEPHRELMQHIIHEFIIVARAQNINLDEDAITDYVWKASEAAKDHYPSMHQDLVQNGRLTEIDFINGAVVRMGKRLGINTPYNSALTNEIHFIEQKKGLI